MDETIGQNISLFESDLNLCALGLPYNLAACEPLRYLFLYCSLLKKPFLFKVIKDLWSFPSLPIIGPETSFKNFDVSLIISYKRYLYIALLIIITPLHLSGFVITMSLLFLTSFSISLIFHVNYF